MVGFGSEAYRDEVVIEDVHWLEDVASLGEKQSGDDGLLVRIRHTGELVGCRLTVQDGRRYRLKLDQPLKGVAPGQSAVLYKHQLTQDICLGGGLIS